MLQSTSDAKKSIFFLLLYLLATGSMVARSEDPGRQTWNQFGGPYRNFQIPVGTSKPNDLSQDAKEWSVAIPAGTSGIVSDGQTLIVAGCEEQVDSVGAKQNIETILALAIDSGEMIWKQSYPLQNLEEQEGFEGRKFRTQATPLIDGGRVFTLGYTGILNALSLENGKVLWECDLVKMLKATPVQFGFSASPVLTDAGLVVHVGGEKAAVVCFQPQSGELIWQSEPGEPAYASPVPTNLHGIPCIIQLTRDHLLILDQKDGSTKLRHPLQKSGLTNVPTPLLCPDNQILVSCQGTDGTRLLEVKVNEAAEWSIEQRWASSRIKPFYCNWLRVDEQVIGFQGKTLIGFNWRNGEIDFQERGYTDSNLIALGEELLLLRGDGLLNRGKLKGGEFVSSERVQLCDERCWTPPTIINRSIFIRTEQSLIRRSLDGANQVLPTRDDIGLTSMDAMWGERPKAIRNLEDKLEQLGNAPENQSEFVKEYEDLVKQQPLSLRWFDFEKAVRLSIDRRHTTLASRLIADWKQRKPRDIPRIAELEQQLMQAIQQEEP